MALTKLEAVLNKISTLATLIIGQATTVKAAFDNDVNVVKDYINDTLTVDIDDKFVDVEGVGRTTETVKGAYDNLDTHKDSSDHDERYFTETEVTALDNENVKKTGVQTVAGVKTFTSSPIVPAPTTDLQASTKKYVDDQVAGQTPLNVPDGSITDLKLSNTAGQIKSQLADKASKMEVIKNFITTITVGPSRNLIDRSALSTGYYVSNSNGTLLANASYSATNYIPILLYTDHHKIFSTQTAFYDKDKTFISGAITAGFTTPENAVYVRTTIANTNLNIEQLEIGSQLTPYQDYNTTSFDFISLSDAIASIQDNSETNRYNIEIQEGVYDVFSRLTADELNNKGVLLPDYVNLVGNADRGRVILNGELPNDTTLDKSTRLSTLNVEKNNDISNIIVTAKNCRYAVHADNTNTFKNYTQSIDNCGFEHFGNEAGLWGTPTAWGEGTASGAKIYAKNSKFITHSTAPAFNTHNNANFEEGDYHEFDNCDFINKDGNVLGFTSLTCGKRCKAVLKGCRLTGAILQNQSNTSITTLDYDISGYGNEQVAHEVVLGSGQTLQTYIAFSEEITTRKNYSMAAITKGTPIKHQFYNQAVAMTSTDDKSMFLGLCAKDCLITDENVIVKTSGYFKIADTTLTGVAVGNKIGVVNGTLAIITDISQAIAVVVSGAWMKLL